MAPFLVDLVENAWAPLMMDSLVVIPFSQMLESPRIGAVQWLMFAYWLDPSTKNRGACCK